MKSSDKLSRLILRRLTQKISSIDRKNYNSSLYAGITVKHFLSMLSHNVDDDLYIRINRLKYEPLLHDYLLIKRFTIKQELIRKEFKEKIVIHLKNVDDLEYIKDDMGEFKSTYGYVIKTIVNIVTD